mmetsp:Transcript_15168/g.53243  ORF Transcript_15168/g.53243 Transcript_15168/m.53243 type:complete len:1715 (-) Transcript_15168:61-5205(-)
MESVSEKRRSLAQHQQKSANDSLQKVSFLKGSKEAFLNQLASSLEVRILKCGDVIAREGQEETEIVLLRRGCLKSVNHLGDEELHRDWAIIGNPLCFQTCIPWAHTVEATDFCDVQLLSAKAYATAVALHPAEGARIAQQFEGALRRCFISSRGPVRSNAMDHAATEPSSRRMNFVSTAAVVASAVSVFRNSIGGRRKSADGAAVSASSASVASRRKSSADAEFGSLSATMPQMWETGPAAPSSLERASTAPDKQTSLNKKRKNSLLPALDMENVKAEHLVPRIAVLGAPGKSFGDRISPGSHTPRLASLSNGASPFSSPTSQQGPWMGLSSATSSRSSTKAGDAMRMSLSPNIRAPIGRGSAVGVGGHGRRLSAGPSFSGGAEPASARRHSLMGNCTDGGQPSSRRGSVAGQGAGSARPSVIEPKRTKGSMLKVQKKASDSMASANLKGVGPQTEGGGRDWEPSEPMDQMARATVDVYQDQHDALHVWAYAMQEDDEASRRELASWLDKIPFFRKMDAFVFERILPIVQKHAFKKGERLLEEGCPSEALHVIYAGYADVVCGNTKFATVGPEAILGERSVANLGASYSDGPTCSASVIVKTTVCVTIVLPRAALAEMVTKDAWLYRQFDDMYSATLTDNGGQALADMPLFKQSDSSFLMQLEVSLTKKNVGPGEFIVKEGDDMKSGLLLVNGTIKVSRECRQDPAMITVSCTKQIFLFGATNLLGLADKSACTVRAMTACKCQVITQDALRKALDCHPSESIDFRRMVEDSESYMSALGQGVVSDSSKAKAQSEARRRAFVMRQCTTDATALQKMTEGPKSGHPKLAANRSGVVVSESKEDDREDDIHDEEMTNFGHSEGDWQSEVIESKPFPQKEMMMAMPALILPNHDSDSPDLDTGRCSPARSETWAEARAGSHGPSEAPLSRSSSGGGFDEEESQHDDLTASAPAQVQHLAPVPQGSARRVDDMTEPNACELTGAQLRAPLQDATPLPTILAFEGDEEESDSGYSGVFELPTPSAVEIRPERGTLERGSIMAIRASIVRKGMVNPSADNAVPKVADRNSDPNSPETRDMLNELCGTKRIIVMHDLRLLPEFCECSVGLLRKLEAFMCLRLYLPEQVVLRQGEEMPLLHILQHGVCTMNVFDTEKETVHGPCIIGKLISMLTPTVVTTVVAVTTCFVSTISKHNIAAVLDSHPKERKQLFATANQVFSDLCDDFSTYFGKEGLAQRLQTLPMLSTASMAFLEVLADILEPKLLLPGQLIVQDPEDVRLFILFEGYCHVLTTTDTVIGTISKNMVFGEVSVFGLEGGARPGTGPVTVKTVEFCQLGTIRASSLFEVLRAFPTERPRFERLVHNRLEESVCTQVSSRPCFDGMPHHLVSKVCSIMERRLAFPGGAIVRQGEPGDSMVIINRGKADVVFSGVVVGMLWAGKTFGSPQMLGVERNNHATLIPKQTCHLLLMSRKSLNSLTVGAVERRWLLSMRERAQATLDAEMRLFHKKLREQKHIACAGMFLSAIAGDAHNSSRFLGSIFYAWMMHTFRLGKGALGTKLRAKDRKSTAPISELKGSESGMRPSHARQHSDDEDEEGSPTRQRNPEMPMRLMRSSKRSVRPGDIGEAPAMHFGRGLRKVQLEDSGEGIVSSAAWRSEAQSGRLDIWKCTDPPEWLLAVRQEIPAQFMAMKREARGEAVPALMFPRSSATSASVCTFAGASSTL